MEKGYQYSNFSQSFIYQSILHFCDNLWKVYSCMASLCITIMCCAVLGRSVMSRSLRPHGLQPNRLLCPWGSSRQEYWSGLPCPSPRDLLNPGIELGSPTLQQGSLPAELPRGALFSSWLYPNKCMHFILMSVLDLMIILHQQHGLFYGLI